MYIEDLIDKLAHFSINKNSYDSQVIHSFRDQFFTHVGLTEKQSALAIKLINKHKTQIESLIGKDIQIHIDNPKFKYKIRIPTTIRTIKIINDRLFNNKVIEVRFPYDEKILTEIRKQPATSMKRWDKELGAWIFEISEENISFLVNLFKDLNFEYDDEYQAYVDQTIKVISNVEQYAPILTKDLKIKNSPKHLPEITAIDTVSAIFQARKFGITLWDDDVNQCIENELNPIVKNFLCNDITNEFNLCIDTMGIECLELIIKQLSPTLFIVPGGSELEKTELAYNLLRGMALPEKNISVLFRLSNETGKNFNEFVKNHQLNTPISEETSVVIVSNKLPKTIKKSGIKFNSVVNMGYNSAHYTLREFVKNHQNLVTLTKSKVKIV
jgi:hypothetical protein